VTTSPLNPDVLKQIGYYGSKGWKVAKRDEGSHEFVILFDRGEDYPRPVKREVPRGL